ncbi:Fc.00g031630.m01.CDS01 [Cosmosporella sp. VM-42]
MNLANNPTLVEELQRQLEFAKARASMLEEYITTVQQPSTLEDLPVQAQVEATILSHGVRSSPLSRSKSTVGYSTQIPMMAEALFHAPKRQRRAFSQQSPSTAMSRSVSNRSDSNMPFVQTGPVAPLTPAIDRYYSSQDEPANQSLQGGLSQRLPSVQENNGIMPDVGQSPDEFLAGFDMAPSYLSARHNLSPQDAYTFNPSACPSMISGSSAADMTSPLTRQNSYWGDAAMTRLASSQSYADQSFDPDSSPPNTNGKRPAPEHELFGFGANMTSSRSNDYSFLSTDSANMERSTSNTSSCSAKSTESNLERRAKEARVRTLENQKATIAPKPQATTAKENATTVKKEARIPVNKSNYQRPKHPKVFCDKCDEKPDGFRGDHELRRHILAKHELTVTKFVCRDPATVGIESTVKAVNPLNKCKACIQGKQYGAYYNAAAHLRRTHFKPKTPRGKSKASADEKRGGKGGGDWPSMADLKNWFEEIQVGVDRPNTASQDIADKDDGDDELEVGMTTPIDMLGLDTNMIFDAAQYGLTVDATDPVSIINAPMAMSTPISSASGSFTYSTFSGASPMSMGGDYAFSDQVSAFSSNGSSSNTISQSTYASMSQLNMSEDMWGVPM